MTFQEPTRNQGVKYISPYFFTSRITNDKSNRLNESQSALIRAKDEQLQHEMRSSNEQIESLKSAAETAKAVIATAQADSAQANQKAAEANKVAEQEQVERLRLEAQIAPRRLSPVQQYLVARDCKQFSGRRVRVVSYSLDSEGAVLAKQIVTTLTNAGMKVEDATASLMPLGGFSLGVHITAVRGKFR